jgi:hypothetical protein
MTFRIPKRLIAPLAACAIAGAATVVGGACLPTATSNPPTLQTGTYVLVAAKNGSLPGIITDSAGRRLRLVADTIIIGVSTQTYEQRATVAITPAGGTEQPPIPFVVSSRAYSMPASGTIVLPATLYGGSIVAYVIGGPSLQLQMPDRSVWIYDYRL